MIVPLHYLIRQIAQLGAALANWTLWALQCTHVWFLNDPSDPLFFSITVGWRWAFSRIGQRVKLPLLVLFSIRKRRPQNEDCTDKIVVAPRTHKPLIPSSPDSGLAFAAPVLRGSHAKQLVRAPHVHEDAPEFCPLVASTTK
jgi:hypothetical protein